MPGFKFNLGATVKDRISGFEGIVICRTEWLNNCSVYGVQPAGLRDGKIPEREHFDEPQLVLVDSTPIYEREKKEEKKTKPGGPAPVVHRTNR